MDSIGNRKFFMSMPRYPFRWGKSGMTNESTWNNTFINTDWSTDAYNIKVVSYKHDTDNVTLSFECVPTNYNTYMTNIQQDPKVIVQEKIEMIEQSLRIRLSSEKYKRKSTKINYFAKPKNYSNFKRLESKNYLRLLAVNGFDYSIA